MRLLALLMLLVLSVSAASAQGYTITTGPGALIAPPYEGAKHMELGFLPWLRATPMGTERRHTVPDDSLGIGITSGMIGVTVVGALRGKRDTNSERVGLRRVGSAIELGLAFDYWPADWLRARAEFRRGVTGHDGWTADLGVDAFLPLNGITLVAGPRLGFGDDAYMNTYFKVTPAQAAANPVVTRSYSPSTGLRYYGVATGAVHRHGAWQEVLGLTWHRLDGEAGRSPMVTQVGDRDQLIITLGIMYTFGIGNFGN